ncbi:MAG: hypothetical protein LC641_13605 [Spirochaeta sp.]|nr:hypothetical protein [Spirochaeta sp.]
MKTVKSAHKKQIRTLAFTLASVALGLALSSCGAASSAPTPEASAGTENDSRPVATFSVDDELLGAPVDFDEGGLQIRPPFGWFVITDHQSEQIRQGLAPLLNPEYEYETLQLYFDGESNTILLVATPEGEQRLEAHAEYYQEALEVQELRLDQFTFGEYELDQLVLVEPSVVVLRYVLQHTEHKDAEIIFAVPSAAFADMIPVVESVVGSALPL